MRVKEALPFAGMLSVQVLITGEMIATKEAIHTGMSNFTYIFYGHAMSTLVLFIASFLIPRSRPPLNFSVVFQCFMVGFIGFFVNLSSFEGLRYAPASLASAIYNIIPGLVFVLASVFRMEKVEWGSSSTLAKSIGVIVSISGAIFATLYQGPQLLMHLSGASPRHLFVSETNMLIGGSIFTLCCTVIAISVTAQALIVKKYSDELIIVFFYYLSVTIVSLAVSLVMEGEQISWSLLPTSRLVAVLFAGCFGAPLENVITLWCMKRKGPLFTSMFLPVGIIVSTILGVLLMGDDFYLGSLIGSVVIVFGLYSFLWGKAREGKIIDTDEFSRPESATGKVPLLENDV